MIKSLKKLLRKGQRLVFSLLYLIEFLISERKKIENSEVVLFIPYYQTGGAERIHLNIVKSIRNKKICVLFTHNSSTTNFYKDFSTYANVIELNKILTKKIPFINRYLKRAITKYINKNKKLISAFGSNTNYYYELLPFLNPKINKVDLIHAISGENKPLIDLYMLGSHYLNTRVVINKKAKSDLLEYYKLNNVDSIFYKKIVVVGNAVELLDDEFKEKNLNKIKIGYIGRWSPEKRLDIFLEIAKRIKKIKPSVDFVMAGIGMKSNLKKINDASIEFLGEITDYHVLQKLYKSLTFILITSYREGFPVVIMEAMANGVIPITTNVGGINEHIENDVNGILINNVSDINKINIDFVNAIDNLINDKEKLLKISKNAYNYAHANFGLKIFNRKYQNILLKKT